MKASNFLACCHQRGLVTGSAGYRGLRASHRVELRRRFVPIGAQARALKAAATKSKTPADLLKIPEIQLALLTAAGLSDKAANRLRASAKREAASGFIENSIEPAGANFVQNLVFRFLLTRGGALGGSMRNIGGFMAQKRLTRAIIACLKLAGHDCQWLHS